MADRTYLDWNATAPLRPQARAAMAAAMDVLGNPSSIHKEGRVARRLVEVAREQVAAAIGADSRNVIFTSGGSEANALALSRNLEDQRTGRRCDAVIVSDLEHASVRAGGDFGASDVGRFDVEPSGVASLGDLRDRLQSAASQGRRMPLAALMAANNETGVIQPIRDAADIIHAAGGLLHVDAVQALGKIPLNINAMGADLVAVSAHKIGGPAGVGALVLGSDRLHFRNGSRFGGGQERNRRGGTENVIGIAGFGAAVAEAVRDIDGEAQRLAALRLRLEQGLREIWPDTIVFGKQAARVANTVQFAVEGIKAETALIALDLEGVAASSGSACASGKVGFSTVVRGMGYDMRIAEGAIRVSFGWTTTPAAIEAFLQAWRKVSQPLLKRQEIAA
jgi:cysteine desulfurase